MQLQILPERGGIKPGSTSLRSANKNDAPLFYNVIAQTMRGFIISTWGAWDEARVQRESREDCLSPEAKVILVKDAEAGVLLVEDKSTHLQVQQIYLLPAYQRCGVGKQLMLAVLAQGRKAVKPVCLRVLRVNPAKQFYEKLGFVVTREETDFFYMQNPAT